MESSWTFDQNKTRKKIGFGSFCSSEGEAVGGGAPQDLVHCHKEQLLLFSMIIGRPREWMEKLHFPYGLADRKLLSSCVQSIIHEKPQTTIATQSTLCDFGESNAMH